MNIDEFNALLATLQAQLDAADRVFLNAHEALKEAERLRRQALADVRGHLTYGKHRGWVKRNKRAGRVAGPVDEAPAAAE